MSSQKPHKYTIQHKLSTRHMSPLKKAAKAMCTNFMVYECTTFLCLLENCYSCTWMCADKHQMRRTCIMCSSSHDVASSIPQNTVSTLLSRLINAPLYCLTYLSQQPRWKCPSWYCSRVTMCNKTKPTTLQRNYKWGMFHVVAACKLWLQFWDGSALTRWSHI